MPLDENASYKRLGFRLNLGFPTLEVRTTCDPGEKRIISLRNAGRRYSKAISRAQVDQVAPGYRAGKHEGGYRQAPVPYALPLKGAPEVERAFEMLKQFEASWHQASQMHHERKFQGCVNHATARTGVPAPIAIAKLVVRSRPASRSMNANAANALAARFVTDELMHSRRDESLGSTELDRAVPPSSPKSPKGLTTSRPSQLGSMSDVAQAQDE